MACSPSVSSTLTSDHACQGRGSSHHQHHNATISKLHRCLLLLAIIGGLLSTNSDEPPPPPLRPSLFPACQGGGPPYRADFNAAIIVLWRPPEHRQPRNPPHQRELLHGGAVALSQCLGAARGGARRSSASRRRRRGSSEKMTTWHTMWRPHGPHVIVLLCQVTIHQLNISSRNRDGTLIVRHGFCDRILSPPSPSVTVFVMGPSPFCHGAVTKNVTAINATSTATVTTSSILQLTPSAHVSSLSVFLHQVG